MNTSNLISLGSLIVAIIAIVFSVTQYNNNRGLDVENRITTIEERMPNFATKENVSSLRTDRSAINASHKSCERIELAGSNLAECPDGKYVVSVKRQYYDGAHRMSTTEIKCCALE